MTSETSSPARSASPEETELMDTFAFPRSSSTPSPKKARRQTAFYPNMNPGNKPQKPFSRSAAKRESVMALGSIEHLQHYFTKTGIAAKQSPGKPNRGLVPAIGSLAHRPAVPSLSAVQEFEIPPTPAAPVFVRPPFPQVEKSYEVDAEILKPGVIRDLDAVAVAWGLKDVADPNNLSVEKGKGKMNDEEFDVLSTLKLTTRLIRSVRNYLVSLPDESIVPQAEKPRFQPRNLTPTPMKRSVSNPNASSDPQTRIRHSAMDVLIALRSLEESARLPLTDEAYDAQSDHGSSQDPGTVGSHSPSRSHSHMTSEDEHVENGHGHDVSFAISVISIPGRAEAVTVWADEDDGDQFEIDGERVEKREVWDDRLVLAGGWLYRPDIHLADLSKEREVIGKYLDTVDELLFQGPDSDGCRGWERAAAEREKAERDAKAKGRRSSFGRRRESRSNDASPSPDRGNGLLPSATIEAMKELSITEEAEPSEEEEEDSIDDEDLPDWAKRSAYSEDPLARAHALLNALLPSSLLTLLPTPYSSRTVLLTSLSSGQLLCFAYNTGVRRSRKPWGYINKDSVHDIAALEARAEAEGDGDGGEAAEKRKTGWTFRRTDNLRLWAAALKLRYLIPLAVPLPTSTSNPSNDPSRTTTSTPTASPAPSKTKFGSTAEQPIIFDAKLVARKDEGWEAMLETVVLRWVSAVVSEKRGER